MGNLGQNLDNFKPKTQVWVFDIWDLSGTKPTGISDVKLSSNYKLKTKKHILIQKCTF